MLCNGIREQLPARSSPGPLSQTAATLTPGRRIDFRRGDGRLRQLVSLAAEGEVRRRTRAPITSHAKKVGAMGAHLFSTPDYSRSGRRRRGGGYGGACNQHVQRHRRMLSLDNCLPRSHEKFYTMALRGAGTRVYLQRCRTSTCMLQVARCVSCISCISREVPPSAPTSLSGVAARGARPTFSQH